ncbi:MAG: pseudouridine synthase [Oscillospiraceae bacterium]
MRQRLQKLISAAGMASRRKSEELIKAGKVTVNGIPALIGDSADPETDIIFVEGRLLAEPAERTYIMLYKPRGYVTTLKDEKNRRCVSELVKDIGVRLYPVGRLDMYSEGLLIMTDDGEFANRLMHPSSQTDKTYYAWVKGKFSETELKVLESPLVIDGYRISPAEVKIIRSDEDYTQLSIRIHEGRNRQIRKMCDCAGLKLTKLKRVSEGSLSVGDLKPGQWRYLTEDELQDLMT